MTNTNYLYTIEVLIGSDTTGENTHEENLLYVKALRSALEAEYPSANVSVEMSRDESSARWYTRTWSGYRCFDHLYDFDETIDLIKTRVWEKMEY